ncbi:hypothetical protein MMC17_006111 [Xylographa soralifera]|nr:hypothetical protein [Xylographa soralifera]
MPVEKQKLRQTCDPCRKAKVRCNRKSPICSRCLASGACCDYGVSNRGGRWKNGEKMGVRVGFDTAAAAAAESPASNPIFDSYIPDASSAMTHFPSGNTSADSCWPHAHDHDPDIWSYDPITIGPLTPFRHFSTPSTPTTHSSSSSLSSIWPPPSLSPSCSSGDKLPQLFPSTNSSNSSNSSNNSSMAPSPDKPPAMPCSCLVIMLQMLQNLHQSFPQAQSGPSSDLPSLNYAIVLDMNEDATSCCATMLRCPSCKADDSIDAFIVLAALLRKVLSLTEAWVTVPEPHDGGGGGGGGGPPERGRSPFAQPPPPPPPPPLPLRQMEHDDERRLKREVALIGIKKMDAVLAQLKQAGQLLQLDYERLTCTSLTVSLAARLKLATAALDQEREAPAAS